MTRHAAALGPAAAALTVVAALAFGCSDRVDVQTGGQCERNSDCAETLVCRLAHCRVQCFGSRDCAAGLRCVKLDMGVGGVCQLPQERECVRTSECPEPLICQFGTCTTACATDRDCLEDATCEPVAMGAGACFEPVAELCIYDSDCPGDLVCDHDQVCRPECVDERDCRYPRMCLDGFCVLR